MVFAQNMSRAPAHDGLLCGAFSFPSFPRKRESRAAANPFLWPPAFAGVTNKKFACFGRGFFISVNFASNFIQILWRLTFGKCCRRPQRHRPVRLAQYGS